MHHTLAAADIPDATPRELAAEAGDLWPRLWQDVVLNCIERRTVIGTPITEYVPDRLVDGRLALVGDAAHVPTPTADSGFSMSLHVAEAVAAGIRGPAMAQALENYERTLLNSVRASVQSGQRFSRSFTGQSA